MEINSEFRHLSLKFVQCYGKLEISSVLDELNSLDLKSQIVEEKHIFEFFETLTRIVKDDESRNVTKLMILIDQILVNQKISVPASVACKVVKWILKLTASSQIVKCDYSCEALGAMRSLLKFTESCEEGELPFDEILTICHSILELVQQENRQQFKNSDVTPQELEKSSLACLDSLLTQISSSQLQLDSLQDDKLLEIGEIIVKSLCTSDENVKLENESLSTVTLKISCLKSIVNLNNKFTVKHLGELIGICKTFSTLLAFDENVKRPTKLYPSQHSIVDQTAGRAPVETAKTTQNKRKSSNKKSAAVSASRPNNEVHAMLFGQYKTSDSDYSDVESMGNSSRHKVTKLRFNSLSLLFSVCWIVDNRTIFGYWQSMMSSEESASSIVFGFHKDPSPKCRILSLQILICLIKKCRNFLMQADNKEKLPMAFTPFSIALGNTLCNLYNQLNQALTKEGNLTVLAQILKCISTFITATPFNRLSTGIIPKLIDQIRALSHHKDPTVQVAALIVIRNIISIKNITNEMYESLQIPKNSKIEFDWKKFDGLLKSENEANEEEEELEDDEDIAITNKSNQDYQVSWLLQTVFKNLGVGSPPSTSSPVKIECLQILAQTSIHYTLLQYCLKETKEALIHSLSSGNDEKLYGAKSLESLGQSMNAYLTEDNRRLDECLAFWTDMIPHIIDNLQNIQQSFNLRSTLASCLSNIGIHVFEKLGKQQLFVISVLTGSSYDENTTVRSSAVRALAVFALFPSMRGDMVFVENTIELILRISRDQDVTTRSKAAWSMGNTVDALILSRGSIRDELLLKMIQECLRGLEDGDRVRINAARTIGNIFTLLNETQMKNADISKCFQSSIKSLSRTLLDCNNDKLKWNICYAFTNIMKNTIFFQANLINESWKEIVFSALFKTIDNSTNFKVRINACVAFKSLERSQIGSFFHETWLCLLVALEKSTELTDYNEYKHRDELQDKICTSLCRLIEISSVEDVNQMKQQLVPVFDVTKQNWNRVFNRWLPEDQGKVFAAVTQLEKLSSEHGDDKSVKFLISCFKPMEFADE